ncbi:MAG: type IV pilus modification protein PilV [Halieaceae bacterium]
MPVRSQTGFTLIEVLVSTLVLTVGILGVAAMQMVSFQTNQSAYARSQAVYLAQDIFDRMRANPTGYRTTTVYDAVDTSNTATIPASPSCVSSTGGCSPAQMAQQDLREWASGFYNVENRDEYRPILPNGVGTLTRDGTSNEFTAVISWNDREFDTAGNLTRAMVTRSISIRATMN